MGRKRFLQLLEEGKLRLQTAKREHEQREARFDRALNNAQQLTPQRQRQIAVS